MATKRTDVDAKKREFVRAIRDACEATVIYLQSIHEDVSPAMALGNIAHLASMMLTDQDIFETEEKEK